MTDPQVLVGTWAVRAQDLAPIPRLAYLTAERAELYRAIVHAMVEAQGRGMVWVRPGDLLVTLQGLYDATLTRETLDRALEQLKRWGTLHAQHDLEAARTIEEFQQKALVVSLDGLVVEVERVCRAFFDHLSARGELDRNLLTHVSEQFQQVDVVMKQWIALEPTARMASPLLPKLRQHWDAGMTALRELVRAGQDFNTEFQHAAPVGALDATQTAALKELLVRNLQAFGARLAWVADVLRLLVEDWQRHVAHRLEPALDAMAAAQAAETVQVRAADGGIMRARYARDADAIGAWVRSDGGARNLRDALERAVGLLTTELQRLSTQVRVGPWREREFRTLADRFFACATLDDADALGALVWGIHQSTHCLGQPRTRWTSAHSLWTPAPVVRHGRDPYVLGADAIVLRPRRRGRLVQGPAALLGERDDERRAVLEAEERERRAMRRWWARVMPGNTTLTGAVACGEFARQQELAAVIAAGLAHPAGVALLPDGRRACCAPLPGLAVLTGGRNDGVLVVPAVTLEVPVAARVDAEVVDGRPDTTRGS